jgi:membrane associated rhomboid family serine protease
MLGAFYAWLGAFDPRSPVAAAAAADAAGIRAGAWWRVFTALTLHADLHHLAGNMASLALLGHQVTARFGGGLGWLLVLAAAAAGNAAAALLLNPDGVSVGASTAGFAALGLLAAWRAARRGAHTGVFDRRTWLPVAAGLALLALLGTGPRSDLGAHALGFAAGALAALPFRRADHGPRSARIQAALQLLALCVLMYAWRRALQSVP